jgi:diacylglycerol kinase family enzyme
VFVNPQSRASRRNPALAAEFQAVIGDSGQVLAPKSLDELDAMAGRLRDERPDIIALHGGDGSLHRALTALGRVFGDEPLPPLALLGGGTMNVVAASLGMSKRPLAVLGALTESVRSGMPLPTIRRRCLRIGDRLGFVFGNGLMSNFLAEYYSEKGYGTSRALWLMARTFFSTLVRGPFARRVFKRFEGEVRVDGTLLPGRRFVGIGAATVREVGLGFKLNHRADDDPERFGVLAIHAAPLALVVDLLAVHDGRGIAPSRAFSAVASTLELDAKAGTKTGTGSSGNGNGAAAAQGTSSDMSYTIDGDLYTGPGPLRISLGPPVLFVKLEAHAKARLRLGAIGGDQPDDKDRNRRLIDEPAGDTMTGGR